MFIDPKDSEKVHKCTFGQDAGTARLKNGTSLASQGQLLMDGKVAHLKITPLPEVGADIRGNSCPGGDISLAKELKCYLDDNLELVSDTNPGAYGSQQCLRAVGALCLEGYSGEGGAACSKCCKKSEPGCAASWYKNTAGSNTVCLKCDETNGALLVAGAMIIGLVLAPLVLKLAEAMKHAGALQGPVMSLINFFQSADLFKNLNLHWPPMFKKFIAEFASLFNFRLPKLPFVVNPECAFSLSYTQKWVLEMASPFILLVSLLTFVLIRTLAGQVAREALAIGFPEWPHAASDIELEAQIRNMNEGEEKDRLIAKAKPKRSKHVVYERTKCKCSKADCRQVAVDWAPYMLLITAASLLFLAIVYVMGKVSETDSTKVSDSTKGKLLVAFVVGLVVLLVGAMLVCFRTKANDESVDAIEEPKTRTEESEEIGARLQKKKAKEKLVARIREFDVQEAKSLVAHPLSLQPGAAAAVVNPVADTEEREVTLRVVNWKELKCPQQPKITVRAASCRQLFARLCQSDGLREHLQEDTVAGAHIKVEVFYQFDGKSIDGSDMAGFWVEIKELEETLDEVLFFVDSDVQGGALDVRVRPFSLEEMPLAELKLRANALKLSLESLGIDDRNDDDDGEAPDVDCGLGDDDGMRLSMRLSMSRTNQQERNQRQEEEKQLQREHDELLKKADEPTCVGGLISGSLCFGVGSLMAFMAVDALPERDAHEYLQLWLPFLASAAGCAAGALLSWYAAKIITQHHTKGDGLLEQALRAPNVDELNYETGTIAHESTVQRAVKLFWRGTRKYTTAAAIAGGVFGAASGFTVGSSVAAGPQGNVHDNAILLSGFVAAAVGGVHSYASTHRFVHRLAVIANFDRNARDDLLRKVRYMLLVYCQVGYVFIVSSALEPLSCIRDVDKRWYMAANPQTECEWCGDGGAAYNHETGELSYPYIAGASYVIASVYSFGIPSLFFYIMYSQRTILRKAEFTQNYGFLTSKTSERFYWWECAIIVRKLVLSIVTKYSVDGAGGDGSIRQSLCNMAVMLIAVTAHVYARPFAHADANAAEMATLFATMLTLLIGMGTIKVKDDDGNTIVNPAEQEAALASGEKTAFYIMLYTSMFALCAMTLVVIARRVGGVLQQLAMGSGRKFKAEFLSTHGWSEVALRRRAQFEGVPAEDIKRALNADSPRDALNQLLRDAWEKAPAIPGLPDEIAELINKNKQEAALAWFNEKLEWTPEPSWRGSIRLSEAFLRRSPGEIQYKVSEDEVHNLIRCIRRYKTFVDDTSFRQKPKFMGMFSETGYTGQEGDQRTGREAMYAWMEGSGAIDELTTFVNVLEEKKREQMWASVPKCVQIVIEKQFMKSREDPAGLELRALGDRGQQHQDETESSEADARKCYANLTIERLCYLLRAVVVGDKKSRVPGQAKGHPVQFGLILAGLYGFGLYIWVWSQLQLCCPSDLSFDQVVHFDEHAGGLDRFGRSMLGEHARLAGCPRTPEQTCEATCEPGYFPSVVLRRKSQARTRNELYTCEKSQVSNWGLISHDLFAYNVAAPYWNHTGLAKGTSGDWWNYPVPSPIYIPYLHSIYIVRYHPRG